MEVKTKNYGKIFGDFMNDPAAFSGNLTECDVLKVVDEIKRLKDAVLQIRHEPNWCFAHLYTQGNKRVRGDGMVPSTNTIAFTEGPDRLEVLIELCDRAITVI